MSADVPGGTEPPEPRDEVVARALHELPVPDHGPAFWDRFEGAVAADEAATSPVRAGAGHSGEVPSVRSLEPARRRRSRLSPWLAVAAGLLLVAAGVGFVVLGDDASDDTDTASTRLTTTTESTAVPPTPSTDTTPTTEPPVTTTVAPGAGDTPEAVATAFIDALGVGDTARAAELLGARSHTYITALGGNVEGFTVEMQEGYGAWAGADDVTITATEVGSVELLGAELAIVTVAGTYPGEGDAAPRVDAFPVVRDDTGWLVELVAFSTARDNRMDFTLPNSDDAGTLGGMQPADEVNVFVPAMGVVFLQIDGGEVLADETSELPSGPFALFDPPGDLPVGTHQLVAVAVGDDGTITHFGGTFLVEG